MPELPEVYSIIKSLNKLIKNEQILEVKVLNSKIINGKSNIREFDEIKAGSFIKNTRSKEIKNIYRRGKIIIIDFKQKGGLVIHLKMTGQLIYTKELEHSNKHTHVMFKLSNGYLFYNDIRKFGYVNYFDSQRELENYTKNLSLDPIEDNFSLEYLKNIKKYNTEIKKVFLDQKIILGIGNIYSDEICFDAGILPTRKCTSLTDYEIEKIYASINKILNRSISLGGSSISDYVLGDGSKGKYQNEHKVYGKGNLKCFDCPNKLEKIKLAGRATVYCSLCQK